MSTEKRGNGFAEFGELRYWAVWRTKAIGLDLTRMLLIFLRHRSFAGAVYRVSVTAFFSDTVRRRI